MRKIGVRQFEQKRYKLIKLSELWAAFLGELAVGFVILVYGESGNGKTEFLLQLLKELVKIGRAVWVSYEQGYDNDLQKAINRNKDEQWYGQVVFAHPWLDIPKFKEPLIVAGEKARPIFQDLVQEIAKSRAIFWFIDSVQDLMLTWEEYQYLRERFPNKCFIFISLAEHKKPKGAVAKAIKANSKVTVKVDKYVAENEKNRMGGDGHWIVYEKKARELNPLYFTSKEGNEPVTKQKKGKKAKA